MWKKHHIAILVVAGIGVLYLIYEWAKGNVASASSDSGSVDTSSLPTVISTGGGGYTPSTPSFLPQDFSSAAQPLSPTASPADTSVTTPGTMTVMPNTSQSGVPTGSNAAQEFNTNTSIAAPSGAVSTPSYYASAADLPYVDTSNPTFVPVVHNAGTADEYTSQSASLLTFLTSDLRSYEVGAQGYLGGGGGAAPTSTADFQSTLNSEAGGFCAIHPESCNGTDQAGLISELVSQYNNFLGQAQATDNQQSQPVQNSAPVATAPSAPAALPPSVVRGGVGTLRAPRGNPS